MYVDLIVNSGALNGRVYTHIRSISICMYLLGDGINAFKCLKPLVRLCVVLVELLCNVRADVPKLLLWNETKGQGKCLIIHRSLPVELDLVSLASGDRGKEAN